MRRSKENRALLEGPHLVGEAIAAGIPLESILATPDFLDTADGRRIAALLDRSPVLVDDRALSEGADVDSPRGVAAVARLPRGGLDAVPIVADGWYLYLDGIQDPGNLGALARVAEAAGGAALVCGPGSAHPNHPRALRASAGSLLRIAVARDVGPQELADLLGAATTWITLDARADRSLYDEPFTGGVVLCLGAEGSGIGLEAQSIASSSVRIPMDGPVESLNVAVAAAVVLYELRRRRSGRG